MESFERGIWKFNNVKSTHYFTGENVDMSGDIQQLTFTQPTDEPDIDVILKDYRKAAEIHKQVRKEMRDMLKREAKLYDIVSQTENRIVQLCGIGDKNNIFKQLFRTAFSCRHFNK